jgi:hypothetical protein
MSPTSKSLADQVREIQALLEDADETLRDPREVRRAGQRHDVERAREALDQPGVTVDDGEPARTRPARGSVTTTAPP